MSRFIGHIASNDFIIRSTSSSIIDRTAAIYHRFSGATALGPAVVCSHAMTKAGA
jgi:hypothetical protein